jgi:transglutaminase-like putative cysteine protease
MSFRLTAIGILLIGVLAPTPPLAAQTKDPWWPAEVDKALARAGANRAELVQALQATPSEQRPGTVFLVVNMPDADLQSLRTDFLLENIALAYQSRREVAWGRQVPDDIFLNDVLPYANVDEARHPWRKQLHELCLPLVKECKTPAEAAHVLNSKLFPKLKVRFSTQRKKANQSPKETIEQGLASCSGLAILLCDACRSVAVPARFAGTPLWANKRGNHSWVEIWDGRWHFAGAAEPDARGLDRAWFVGDAAQATKNSRVHAIYAASFKRTGVTFPLVWAPDRADVFAENVTDHYAKAEPAKAGLAPEQLRQIEQAARAFFTANREQQAKWDFPESVDQWLASHEAAVRQAAWKAYQAAPIHAGLKEDFDKHVVTYEKHLSPYTVKKVGKRPAKGWPLFVAMHGGGGAPQEVNDSQWKHMQIYYRDQPSVEGYVYVALRAPNNTWNGFYDNYVPPLVTRLIRQFLLFGDVDSDKVYLMGYSHGGYGAFFVGPKIPDRFAAVHSSAAAPTDGTISPKSLRNTRFTFMIGEMDNAYGRRERCLAFNKAVQKLKELDKDDFPVVMELKKGFGHGGLPDRDKIKEMYPFTRNAVPRHLTWELTDALITHFFWLAVPQPGPGQSIDATFQDNAVQITTSKVKQFDLNLDGRLIAFDRPLRVVVDGKTQVFKLRPSFLILCRSMRERGDPELTWTCQLRLEPGAK